MNPSGALMQQTLRSLLLAGAGAASASAAAHDALSLPPVEVTERVESRTALGAAAAVQPAPVIVITADEIAEMQVDHVLDIFRDRVGVVVRQLNQGDVGDDFGLRGFAGGHGVDAAVYVDGVPVNQVNGRTHGLADLNWLAPAMIERIEIIKGPFSARHGNFALGGVVRITTRSALERSELALTAGRYGHAAGVLAVGHADGLVVSEAFRRQGYRDNADSERVALFGRYGFDVADGRLSMAVQADRRDFGATGYLPVDDVRAGLRNRRDAINPTDGGEVEHAQAWVGWDGRVGAGWDLDARAYAIVDERSRYADFGTGQSATLTDLSTIGAAIGVERVSSAWLYAFGLHARRDDGDRRAFRSTAGVTGAITSDRAAETLETGVWGELQWAPRDDFKATVGVRHDRFDSDVANRWNPSASGDDSGDVLSPRAGVAWRPVRWIEIYANRGRGFRSASQIELSPDVRNARFQPLEPFELDSQDLGLRVVTDAGFSAEVALYRTDTEGEFVQIAPGEFANLGATTRDGVEGELRWRGEWLEVFFGATRIDAELVTTSAARAVTGVPDATQVGGVTVRGDAWVFDAYGQRYGRAPLNASGSVERPPVRSFGSKLSRRYDGFDAWLQVAWNPDADRAETQFLINNRNAYDPLPRIDVQVGVSIAL